MRKKLFAVIMSAMMMITFMPAMAFAALNPGADGTTNNSWLVSGVEGFVPGETPGSTVQDGFVYDGQEHTITYNPANDTGYTYTVTYTGTYAPYTANGGFGTAVKLDKMVAKDAGRYVIGVKIEYSNIVNGRVMVYDPVHRYLNLTVEQRPVSLAVNKTVATKAYDGKPYTFSDADVAVSALALTAQGTINGHTYWNRLPVAKQNAASGLVAGEKLYTGTLSTIVANVGAYSLNYANLGKNLNYCVYGNPTTVNNNVLEVTITKATPNVKITSNTLMIKKGKAKAVKATTDLGTVKLTKKSGNTKIKFQNGKLKVAKSCKKGTYKIVMKASVAEDTANGNWIANYRTKTIKVIVE